MHRFIVTLAIVAAALASSCQSSPAASPADIAEDIAESLAAGDKAAAEGLFDEVEDSPEHREVVYSVLYAQAQERYVRQDYASAESYLRFLVEHYDRAGAPREALLYTLFLARRAGRAEPPPDETLSEMERLLARLRTGGGEGPVWLSLVSAQIAVDRGRIEGARSSLARFRAAWDGSPASLRPYVEEIDRYVTTHAEEE